MGSRTESAVTVQDICFENVTRSPGEGYPRGTPLVAAEPSFLHVCVCPQGSFVPITISRVSPYFPPLPILAEIAASMLEKVTICLWENGKMCWKMWHFLWDNGSMCWKKWHSFLLEYALEYATMSGVGVQLPALKSDIFCESKWQYVLEKVTFFSVRICHNVLGGSTASMHETIHKYNTNIQRDATHNMDRNSTHTPHVFSLRTWVVARVPGCFCVNICCSNTTLYFLLILMLRCSQRSQLLYWVRRLFCSNTSRSIFVENNIYYYVVIVASFARRPLS